MNIKEQSLAAPLVACRTKGVKASASLARLSKNDPANTHEAITIALRQLVQAATEIVPIFRQYIAASEQKNTNIDQNITCYETLKAKLDAAQAAVDDTQDDATARKVAFDTFTIFDSALEALHIGATLALEGRVANKIGTLPPLLEDAKKRLSNEGLSEKEKANIEAEIKMGTEALAIYNEALPLIQNQLRHKEEFERKTAELCTMITEQLLPQLEEDLAAGKDNERQTLLQSNVDELKAAVESKHHETIRAALENALSRFEQQEAPQPTLRRIETDYNPGPEDEVRRRLIEQALRQNPGAFDPPPDGGVKVLFLSGLPPSQ